MFYFQVVLGRQGPLAKIWAAAHTESRLSKAQILSTCIDDYVEAILEPTIQMSLRINAHLLFGLVRIFTRQVNYALQDAQHLASMVQQPNRKATTPRRKSSAVASHQLAPGQDQADLDAITLPELNIDPLCGLDQFVTLDPRDSSRLQNHDRITLHEDPLASNMLKGDRWTDSLVDAFRNQSEHANFVDYLAAPVADDGFGWNPSMAPADFGMEIQDGPPLRPEDDGGYSMGIPPSGARPSRDDTGSFVLEPIDSCEMDQQGMSGRKADRKRRRLSLKGIDKLTVIPSSVMKARLTSCSDIVEPTITFAPVTRFHMMVAKYGDIHALFERPNRHLASKFLSRLNKESVKKLSRAYNVLSRAISINEIHFGRSALNTHVAPSGQDMGGDEDLMPPPPMLDMTPSSEMGRDASRGLNVSDYAEDLGVFGKRAPSNPLNMSSLPSPIVCADDDAEEDAFPRGHAKGRRSDIPSLNCVDPLESPSSSSSEQIDQDISVNSLRLVLLSALTRRRAVTYEELTRGKPRKEAARTFLNLLVLYKEGFLNLSQQLDYGEIAIEGRPQLKRPYVGS